MSLAKGKMAQPQKIEGMLVAVKMLQCMPFFLNKKCLLKALLVHLLFKLDSLFFKYV